MKHTRSATGLVIAMALLSFALNAIAQIPDAPDDSVAGIPVNYTEAKSGTYTLPDPLRLANGDLVRDTATWADRRRPQIVSLFETSQHGRSPGRQPGIRYDVFDKGTPAFGGKATRRQITIRFVPENESAPAVDLLLYVPANSGKPVPVLLNLSFTPSALAVEDPGVRETEPWNPRTKQRVPAREGRRFGHLPVEAMIDRGFGIATLYYGDIDPDFEGGVPFGVRNLFKPTDPKKRDDPDDDWGAIAAWAWGLSRALDYLETDAAVDAKRVAIMGVSRLGKTVLWAGAQDTRFALVIASCSGESGAALSRRNYGETVAHMNARFAYQFCANYRKYGGDVSRLPVDAHMLIALLAPRPVLLITGKTDKWSDPYGEYLAAVAASPVYELFGKRGLAKDAFPPAGHSLLRDIGYFMHDGGHGPHPSDLEVIQSFLKAHLLP